MAIDTVDLSDKTYKSIMIEAESFDHNLTLQFGLLFYECKDEPNFIKKSKQLINRMLKFGKDQIDEMFFSEPPAKNEFHKTLNKILENISSIENEK